VLRHRAQPHRRPGRTAAPPPHHTRSANLTWPTARPTTATAAPCHRAGPGRRRTPALHAACAGIPGT
jgi:hypothetical protein